MTRLLVDVNDWQLAAGTAGAVVEAEHVVSRGGAVREVAADRRVARFFDAVMAAQLATQRMSLDPRPMITPAAERAPGVIATGGGRLARFGTGFRPPPPDAAACVLPVSFFRNLV